MVIGRFMLCYLGGGSWCGLLGECSLCGFFCWVSFLVDLIDRFVRFCGGICVNGGWLLLVVSWLWCVEFDDVIGLFLVGVVGEWDFSGGWLLGLEFLVLIVILWVCLNENVIFLIFLNIWCVVCNGVVVLLSICVINGGISGWIYWVVVLVVFGIDWIIGVVCFLCGLIVFFGWICVGRFFVILGWWWVVLVGNWVIVWLVVLVLVVMGRYILFFIGCKVCFDEVCIGFLSVLMIWWCCCLWLILVWVLMVRWVWVSWCLVYMILVVWWIFVCLIVIVVFVFNLVCFCFVCVVVWWLCVVLLCYSWRISGNRYSSVKKVIVSICVVKVLVLVNVRLFMVI